MKYVFRTLLVCTLSIIFIISVEKRTLGSDSSIVPATVKIGICGDGVAEGEEDCDNEDLLDKTCVDLGYGSGVLTCHPSCTFDESLCIPKPPTPPKPPSKSDKDENGSVRKIIRTIVQTIITTVEETPSLPTLLQIFDINSNGIIETEELFSSAKMWFDSWKSALVKDVSAETKSSDGALSCDLNNDKKCDLVDFSILMYYIGRE